MRKYSVWPQVYAAAADSGKNDLRLVPFRLYLASLIMICTGFHYGWPSASLQDLLYGENGAQIKFSEYSWIVIFLHIGSIFGSIIGVFLADLFGRKKTLLLTTGPFVISCILLALVKTFWLFNLARFIAGLGVGVSLTVTPMYIGEIAEPRIRGRLCALMPLMIIIGIFASAGLGVFIMAVSAIGGIVLPVVFGTALLWAPESPYYYAIKKIRTETEKSVKWLRRTPDVVQEVQQIHDSLALNQRRGPTLYNLFRVPGNLKALFTIIGLFTFQNLCGVDTIFVITQKYLSSAFNITILSLLANWIPLIGAFLVVFLVDIVGRRPLLLISASSSALFLLVSEVCNRLLTYGNDDSILVYIPIILIGGFLLGYSIGIGTLPIVLAAELFPCEVKGLALGIVSVYNIVGKLIITQIYMLIFTLDNNYAIPIMIIISNFLCVVFIYFIIPETKGRSLSEIQSGFRREFKSQT